MVSDNLGLQAADPRITLREDLARNIVKQSQSSQQQDGRIELKKPDVISHSNVQEGKEPKSTSAIESDIFSLAKQEKDERELGNKVEKLNRFFQNLNRDLHFSVHKETGRVIVTVVDAETDKVIRKIPSDEILKIAESLENLSGLLFNKQA